LYITSKHLVIKLKDSRKTRWCIPVTAVLDIALEKAVSENSHISKSEFIRDAVRRRLEDMGFKHQVFDKTLQERGNSNS
jgi:metal-responsive CopG/Arc/MetJ family transcriptional regulator